MVQESVGGAELLQRKAKIQAISDQTSSTLKRHVYENYKQFIDTSHEISHLESEMYQLSHILIEQRNCLSILRDTHVDDTGKNLMSEESAVDDGDETGHPESGESAPKSLQDHLSIDSNRNTIELIKESLAGFAGNLDNKCFVHEGGLIELDSTDYRPICRTHIFLFNDCLIMAKVRHDKSLFFLAQYETKQLAMINIRDLDGVRNALNLMTPDGSRIFQCVNAAAKSEWIEKFGVAVKSSQQPIQQPPQPKKKGPAPKPPVAKKQSEEKAPMSQQSSIDLSPLELTPTVQIIYAPEWLNCAPEETQALIAQRHFEDALALIQKSQNYLAKDSSCHNSAEIAGKITELKVQLTSVLLSELSSCSTRSQLSAALRASRRALKLLGDMKKAREATGTMLSVCTTAIRTAQRQARRNNLETSELFFCDLALVVNEFLRAFRSQGACTSALVVWCNLELQYFASQIIKHYLAKTTELDVAAKVVEGVRVPCAKLNRIGLDLLYYMEGLLRNSLETIVEESRNRLVAGISRQEDVWQPFNVQSKSKVRALLREMDALGMDLQPYVTGDTWINLSQSTIQFCRQFINVTKSCATLARNESLKVDLESLLRDMFLAQMAVKPNPHVTVDVSS